MPSIPNGRPRSHGHGATMRAAIWNGTPHQVQIESVPKPRLLASEDAIVRLTSAAICGTDLHIYHGIFGSANPPWILGHEGVGIVQEVGEAVQNVKPGDRVIVPALLEAGVLTLDQLVPPVTGFGLGNQFGTNDGLQAEYVRIQQADTSLIPIPHYPSHELSYLMISDIWGTAWTALDAAGFRPGESVAVFGAGPVGLLCAFSALFRGASRVYVVDHVKARLAKAKEIGAIPIDFSKGNASQQILKFEKKRRRSNCLNGQLKPQQNAVLNDAIAVTTAGGGIGVIGVYSAQQSAPGRPEASKVAPTINFPMTDFWNKELSMKAAVVNPEALASQLVELIKRGRVDLSWLISSVINIEQVPEAYRRFDKHLETKVVIRFNWENEEWEVARGEERVEEEEVDLKIEREVVEINGVGKGSGDGFEHTKGNGFANADWNMKAGWKSLEDIEGEL